MPPDPSSTGFPQTVSSGPCHVSLTYSPLDILSTINLVRSPSAGAIVMFAGTTRSHFSSHPIHSLSYTSYPALALRSMLAIAQSTLSAHSLTGIALVHRLGTVPIGEESVLIVVAAPHRKEAWRAGEEALEEVKRRVEVWKREVFLGEGGEGMGRGVWRANGGDRDEDGEENGGKEGGEERGDGNGVVEVKGDGLGMDEELVRPGLPVEKGYGAVVHDGS